MIIVEGSEVEDPWMRVEERVSWPRRADVWMTVLGKIAFDVGGMMEAYLTKQKGAQPNEQCAIRLEAGSEVRVKPMS